jgi:tetratricopeptide (TPR) repeat protein
MKTKYVLLLILAFQFSQTYGQIHLEMKKINVDSLQSILHGLDGIEKIDALNKISFALFVVNPDSCIAIANKTLSLSENLDYPKGKADALFNLGNAFFIQDTLKPCVIHYLNALRIYEELQPSIKMGLVLQQLSNLNYMTDRLDKAIIYGKRATGIFNHFSETGYESAPLIRIGLLFTLEKKFDSAIYYYDRALKILKLHPDPWRQTIAYLDYGWTIFEQGSVDQSKEYNEEALKWFFKSLESARKHGLAEENVMCCYNIGATLVATGTEENIDNGLEFYRDAIEIADTLNEIFYVKMGLYRNLGRNEYRLGNYRRAIAYCEQGLREAEEKKASHVIAKYKDPFFVAHDMYYYNIELRKAYSFIYNCYIKLGDYKKALEYYQLKEKFSEHITQEKNNNLIAMLEAESENEKTEKKIALLARDNELNEMKVTQSHNFNIGVAVLFLILLLVGLLFLRQNKLKNEHKSTLLEQKLLRLQMNPHFIYNAFSNILRLIDTNDNKKASAYLTTFGKLLRTTLESTREDMVSFEKEVGTLRNYLDLQKLRHPEKFEYSLEIDKKIDQEDMSIPPMLIQPFIENAIEHGIRHKKTIGRIDVRFELKDKKIICEVEDNGVGREKAWEAEFAERGDRKSLATEIIMDRIQVLNKKFKQKIKLEIIDIKSEESVALGTKVLLDLPYGSVY